MNIFGDWFVTNLLGRILQIFGQTCESLVCVVARYVRNIPMSAVLDRGGLQQRWVGVNLANLDHKGCQER